MVYTTCTGSPVQTHIHRVQLQKSIRFQGSCILHLRGNPKIRKLYTEYTEHDGAIYGADPDGATATAIGSAGLLEQAWDEHCRAHGEGGMLPPVASSYPEAERELDRYLKDRLAPQTEGFDILNWWKAHSLEYPTVAWMARDALAMPTCSQLSSEKVAHVRSILRGYSKEAYKHQVGLTQ